MKRIAFDLDETLGVPLVDESGVLGWQLRQGCAELLDRLQPDFVLMLWSASSRVYVDKALASGLSRWFTESHSWDESPTIWKDVRQLHVDFLIDDSPHHQEAAKQFGLATSYIVVPRYGSPEDTADPRLWIRVIDEMLTGRTPPIP